MGYFAKSKSTHNQTMKTLLISSLLFFATITATQAQRTTLMVDTKASSLTWTGYAEIGSYAPTGSIQFQKGQVTLTNNQVTGGTFVINMATIQHENSQLQGHLREETFFDVTKYPTATFVLTKLTGQMATGLLTTRGVTKPLTFPVVVSREGEGVRIKGRAVIDRTQYGIRYNSTSFFADLGDQAIKNTFALTFDVLAKPVAPAKPGVGGSL